MRFWLFLIHFKRTILTVKKNLRRASYLFFFARKNFAFGDSTTLWLVLVYRKKVSLKHKFCCHFIILLMLKRNQIQKILCIRQWLFWFTYLFCSYEARRVCERIMKVYFSGKIRGRSQNCHAKIDIFCHTNIYETFQQMFTYCHSSQWLVVIYKTPSSLKEWHSLWTIQLIWNSY